jgi:hypothetical protein
VGVTFQPCRVPITLLHPCRRDAGQFTSGIDVRILSSVFRSQSRVRDVDVVHEALLLLLHFAIRTSTFAIASPPHTRR